MLFILVCERGGDTYALSHAWKSEDFRESDFSFLLAKVGSPLLFLPPIQLYKCWDYRSQPYHHIQGVVFLLLFFVLWGGGGRGVFKIYFTFSYVYACVAVGYVCMWVQTPLLVEARWGHQIPWDWSYWQLRATMYVLGMSRTEAWSLTMDSKHNLFQVNRLLCILGLQVEIQRYHDLSHI